MNQRLRTGALSLGLLALAACSSAQPSAGPTPSASAAPVATATSAVSAAPRTGAEPTSSRPSPSEPEPTVVEPTTTNTLPPPQRPSKPAPSTAGKLTAKSLPVPAGWKTVARTGGVEEGYLGNGTWVHARDPRYAAQAVISIGCADVTRDDYPDPTAALEGTYKKAKGGAGIGLVLQFATAKKAAAYWRVYRQQVSACSKGDGPVSITVVASDAGLIDKRKYDDGDWTEVGVQSGTRVTLVILTDEGHRITRAESEALLRKIGTG